MINDKTMRTLFLAVLSFIIFQSSFSSVAAQVFVELNCENLFDTQHDDGKQDSEFTPDGERHWTRSRYWRKLNAIGQEILSCSESLPDLVALLEVENDTVLRDLTRRSLLRGAGYEYIMTCSPDVRGLDVALLYNPARFKPLCYDFIGIEPLKDMRPTRDILYVRGQYYILGDTLHLFLVHAPSRYGGELTTRPHRMLVVSSLLQARQGLEGGDIIVAGDFNDYWDSPSLKRLTDAGFVNVSQRARGSHGNALGTYRYQGEWHSLDHVLLSPELAGRADSVYINDTPFLLEAEQRYGGWKPRRTFNGYRYQRGFSDHLPLVLWFR